MEGERLSLSESESSCAGVYAAARQLDSGFQTVYCLLAELEVPEVFEAQKILDSPTNARSRCCSGYLPCQV